MRFYLFLCLLSLAFVIGCDKRPTMPDPLHLVSPLVDIKVNNADGVVRISGDAPFKLTWISSNVTACELIAGVNSSGITLRGEETISPANSWYPRPGEAMRFMFGCALKEGGWVYDTVYAYNN